MLATLPSDSLVPLEYVGLAARIRCRMPCALRWVDHIADRDGELIELTHVWTLKGSWRRWPGSSAEGWRVRRIGPFVLAYRVV